MDNKYVDENLKNDLFKLKLSSFEFIKNNETYNNIFFIYYDINDLTKNIHNNEIYFKKLENTQENTQENTDPKYLQIESINYIMENNVEILKQIFKEKDIVKVIDANTDVGDFTYPYSVYKIVERNNNTGKSIKTGGRRKTKKIQKKKQKKRRTQHRRRR